jgi:hypothetical protein
MANATPVASNRVAGKMTATTTDNVIDVENILCGFRSLQVLISLENVLLKSSQFQTKQKSSQQAHWHSWHHEGRQASVLPHLNV